MKFALVCFSFLAGCAVLFAFIWESIDGGLGSSQSNGRTRETGPPFPGDQLDDIFWLVQISDIHISRFWDLSRSDHLLTFLRDHVPVIKPDVILATGDLVDAKTVDHQGSRQYKDEWQSYWRAIQESGVLHSTVWLDIRGNHDAFDVPSLDSKKNLFRKYSIKGVEHTQSYMYQLKKRFGTYNFIGVDACPDPGPKRPFNFFGHLTKERLDSLQEYATASRRGNMTIWFGHYPTSTIVADPPGLRTMLGGGVAYVSGHLHTLGNLVPHMYTYQYAGYLELELGDWKDNRIYRIMAVDHDMMSFTDESFDHWPVVLITNPKHALFQVPHHEALSKMAKSTHIRILVFSPNEITNVEVEVDGVPLDGVFHSSGPLYVVPWEPSNYILDLHTISVIVQDNKGNAKEVSQPFSLDGSRPYFRLIPSLVLMLHIDVLGKLLFIVICLSVIIPLLLLKQYTHLPTLPKTYSRLILLRWPGTFFNTGLKWVWLVSRTPCLCNSLVSFTVYVAVGPWFVGELMYGYYGVAFSWGVLIKSSYIPGSITYIYGFLQILLFNIPLLLYFGYALDYNTRHKLACRTSHSKFRIQLRPWRDWFLVLLIVYQAYLAWSGFYLAYGGVALLLGPVRTWSILMALLLHQTAVSYGSDVHAGQNLKNHINNCR